MYMFNFSRVIGFAYLKLLVMVWEVKMAAPCISFSLILTPLILVPCPPFVPLYTFSITLVLLSPFFYPTPFLFFLSATQLLCSYFKKMLCSQNVYRWNVVYPREDRTKYTINVSLYRVCIFIYFWKFNISKLSRNHWIHCHYFNGIGTKKNMLTLIKLISAGKITFAYKR